jgi:sugar-specific transcriptional regulator TrmB
MHIQSVLHQLGYPMNQVKLYLAALEMGETNIADLSNRVKMPRTTVTELVRELTKQGLMNYYVKRGRKYWVAENPDKLMVMVKEREAALQTVLPQLHALKFDSGAAKPNIRMYVGSEEVKNIYHDIIETKHHMMALVSWDDSVAFFGSDFMQDFIDRRSSRFLNMRLIAPKTPLSLALKRHDDKELRVTRFLPDTISLRGISHFIYDGKTAIISFNRTTPTGIIIHDPDIAHAQGVYFQSLWQMSSEK